MGVDDPHAAGHLLLDEYARVYPSLEAAGHVDGWRGYQSWRLMALLFEAFFGEPYVMGRGLEPAAGGG